MAEFICRLSNMQAVLAKVLRPVLARAT
ncbi:hypothetical protein A2U01_0050651, partial [Trifolium medium]|nr:hypothetical protein [Trifolium medium]